MTNNRLFIFYKKEKGDCSSLVLCSPMLCVILSRLSPLWKPFLTCLRLLSAGSLLFRWLSCLPSGLSRRGCELSLQRQRLARLLCHVRVFTTIQRYCPNPCASFLINAIETYITPCQTHRLKQNQLLSPTFTTLTPERQQPTSLFYV